MAKVPVFDAKTGMRLVQEVKRGSADVVAELVKMNTHLAGIPGVFTASGAVTRDADGAYTGLTLATPFDDITAACLDGKLVVLHVRDEANAVSYFALLTKASGLGTNIVTLSFDCSGDNNPTGKNGAYNLMYVASANWLQFSVQSFGTAASDVACDITIGETKYTNIADALAALAAK